jgi:hypothetical protein
VPLNRAVSAPGKIPPGSGGVRTGQRVPVSDLVSVLPDASVSVTSTVEPKHPVCGSWFPKFVSVPAMVPVIGVPVTGPENTKLLPGAVNVPEPISESEAAARGEPAANPTRTTIKPAASSKRLARGGNGFPFAVATVPCWPFIGFPFVGTPTPGYLEIRCSMFVRKTICQGTGPGGQAAGSNVKDSYENYLFRRTRKQSGLSLVSVAAPLSGPQSASTGDRSSADHGPTTSRRAGRSKRS